MAVNKAGNYTKPTMRKNLFNKIKAGGKGGKKHTIKKPCPGIQHQKRTILKNCANPPPTTREVECEAECTTTRPSKKKKKGFFSKVFGSK